MAILEACTREHGSSVKPERLRRILKQHNDEPALQEAVLRYLYEKKDNTGRPETLAPFLKSQNPDLAALALLVQSKQIPQLRSADQYNSFVNHPSSKVRQAAAVAMMSSGVPLPPMSAFDCFSASKLLRFDHYELGFEARLANAMEAAIEARCSTTSSIEVVHLELPLLHLLQRIDAGCPGFLDAIERSGVGSFERFCAALREMIKEERDAVRDRVILNSETSLCVAMHSESLFSEAYVADLGISAGIPLMYAIKEGENKKQSAPPIANQPRQTLAGNLKVALGLQLRSGRPKERA